MAHQQSSLFPTVQLGIPIENIILCHLDVITLFKSLRVNKTWNDRISAILNSKQMLHQLCHCIVERRNKTLSVSILKSNEKNFATQVDLNFIQNAVGFSSVAQPIMFLARQAHSLGYYHPQFTRWGMGIRSSCDVVEIRFEEGFGIAIRYNHHEGLLTDETPTSRLHHSPIRNL
mmetsp:Transcript_12965/g.17812  ORF Transcript_12965/g.17812 Transcript_12965/m.17812 type:complete len:174 (-) Transcript_12965:45-566(-)